MIAYIFDIKIQYYTARDAEVQVYNPGAEHHEVSVCFINGNHFERMSTPEFLINDSVEMSTDVVNACITSCLASLNLDRIQIHYQNIIDSCDKMDEDVLQKGLLYCLILMERENRR